MKISTCLCLVLLGLTSARLPAQSGGQGSASTSAPLSQNPRPNPDAGIYHVGDGVSPPVLLSSVDPKFSDRARKKG